MFRAFNKAWLVGLAVVMAGPSVFGFSLLGPSFGGDAYQVAPPGQIIGYNLPGDLGAPKNLGEGYRWNTRNLWYAVDANFLNYFGSNGLAAVDQAFGIFNSLSNVSSYSSDLSEWPLNTTRINGRAEALGLMDVKSVILGIIAEQMGLAQPDRWTWAIRSRAVGPPPGCPIEVIYDIIKRNFDPVTYEPSSYVNGTLYTYFIIDNCVGANPIADAVEVQVDPNAETFTAIASRNFLTGQFVTGLTRDDVGGLRYQIATNRMYVEPMEAVTPTFLVNTNNSLSLLVTSNLDDLLTAQLTNSGAQLAALFPGLVVSSSVQLGFSNVVTTNVTTFLTNNPFGPPGSTMVALATNITTNFAPIFQNTFANVVTNTFWPISQVTILTTNVTANPFGPPGSLVTNVTSTPTGIFRPAGDFFVIPTNQCGFSVISTQLTQILPITSPVLGTTNQADVFFFTNHTLVVSTPTCLTNTSALREGIEKVHFFRQDFDSLLSQTWQPVTNTFSLTAVSNNVPVTQNFYRVLTQPDILITASDLAFQPAPTEVTVYSRSISFNSNDAGALLSGPGIIQPRTTFSLNKVGPIYFNPGNGGLPNTFIIPPFFQTNYGEFSQELWFIFASFDGTTNDPVVYPSGTSIVNLENNVFLQILLTGPLTNGNVGQFYSVQLQATGAQPPPYTWSVAANVIFQGTLPPGLSINPSTGLISGTPTTTGVYDFMIEVDDTTGRASRRNLSIEIDP